jgi:hypothetical protein
MPTDRKILAATVAVIAMLTAGPARAALSPPSQTAPAAGATVTFLPAFAWTPVQGADRYEFQISADPGMGSPVLGSGKDDFFTHNTRATLEETVPNGSYYWRVRAVSSGGATSAWTPAHKFTKLWNLQPAIQTPADGAAMTFPSNPVVLRWSGIPGAAEYLVPVASDPLLGSIVFKYSNQDDPSGPPNVAATSAAIASPLAPGSYYWAVEPVDAEGNRGVSAPVRTFNWVWPSVTSTQVTDLDPSAEVFDPKFSWNPVPGAARYEVEINPSVDFAPGSKVCCTGTTIATSLSPPKVFKNDTYHWRVRAIDADGNAGVWNVGSAFQKTFDTVPPVTDPSIKNLHMRDNTTDPGVDLDGTTPGYQTQVPIVTWNPVPGASAYQVEVAPYDDGAMQCNWTAQTHHWVVVTAVNAWTPLGDGWNSVKPYPDALPVANELISLVNGAYCVRVRARTDRDTNSQDVYGGYTYLDDGTGRGTAFDFTGYPSGGSAGCNSGYLCSGDYLTPTAHFGETRTPYFTWNTIAGAQSYFVLVSKDSSFTSIVDYGFTHVPAYAPRTGSSVRTYTDETNPGYYWAVLPAQGYDGGLAKGNPLLANYADFTKQSTPPSLISPAAGQSFLDQPSFRWGPAEGARRYRLQVASDQSFSNLLDDVTTDGTSYSSNTTYPADTVLYWRVRADDENLTGLTWSATGTFQKTLAVPVPSASNPTSGDMLPVWSWAPVQGASSYDVEVDQPDGNHRIFTGLRSPVVSFIKMTGTGIWHWRVRAEFPQAGSSETPGPYSALHSFTRTIGNPTGLHTDSSTDHVLLSWNAKTGVKDYHLEIASSPDFSTRVDDTTTDNTSYAPTMTTSGYNAGGTLFWRVAGVDEDHNQGDWSQTEQLKLQPKLKMTVIGIVRHGHASRVRVSVTDGRGQRLGGVLVRITGKHFKARSHRTNAQGRWTFTVKAKKRGQLLVKASLAGYQTAYGTVKVK